MEKKNILIVLLMVDFNYFFKFFMAIFQSEDVYIELGSLPNSFRGSLMSPFFYVSCVIRFYDRFAAK